jgi:hypothetical protein
MNTYAKPVVKILKNSRVSLQNPLKLAPSALRKAWKE